MGIGAYIIQKYYEFFTPSQEDAFWDIDPTAPIDKLYQRSGDKICFGCNEYQLCFPNEEGEEKNAGLLYCRKCDFFYTTKQYEILSQTLARNK